VVVSDVEVVEIPDLGSVRKHLAAARVHLDVCRYRGSDLSKRHARQLELAQQWIRQLEKELDDAAIFGRADGIDLERLRARPDDH
jgi:hypothetical protein